MKTKKHRMTIAPCGVDKIILAGVLSAEGF